LDLKNRLNFLGQTQQQSRKQLSTMYIFIIVAIVCFSFQIANAHVKFYYEPAKLPIRNAKSATGDGMQ
jgi:hypothetical protein